jgi:hypothetical protein
MLIKKLLLTLFVPLFCFANNGKENLRTPPRKRSSVEVFETPPEKRLKEDSKEYIETVGLFETPKRKGKKKITEFTPKRVVALEERLKLLKTPEKGRIVKKLIPFVQELKGEGALTREQEQLLSSVLGISYKLYDPICIEDLFPVHNFNHIFYYKLRDYKATGYHRYTFRAEPKVRWNFIDENLANKVYMAFFSVYNNKIRDYTNWKLSTFFPDYLNPTQIKDSIKFSVKGGKRFVSSKNGEDKILGISNRAPRGDFYIESILKSGVAGITSYPILYFLKVDRYGIPLRRILSKKGWIYRPEILKQAKRTDIVYSNDRSYVINVTPYIDFFRNQRIRSGVYIELPKEGILNFPNLEKTLFSLQPPTFFNEEDDTVL